MKKTALVLTLAALAPSAWAAQDARSPSAILPEAMHIFVNLGLAGGGDELYNAYTTDGDIYSIKAGRGVTWAIGLDYRIAPQFSTLLSVGYQYDRIKATNGKLEFSRVPVELLGFYDLNQQWRIGGGLRYVSSPTLSGSGVFSMPDFAFDSSTGSVLEVEYRASQHWGFQLRYVHESYTLDGYRGAIRGDSGGAGVRWYF